eukprot:s3100_g1.t1
MLRHLSRYKSGGNSVVREYGGRVKDSVSYLFPDALHKYFKRYADPRDADGMLSWSGANFADTCTAGEVQKRLEGAIEARMEGLVIKDTASKYFFNARKRGWYKIKPEYDGLSETLDLIVVGAYFGDSAKRRGGAGTSTDLADNCAQFLLAAKRHNSGPEASVLTVCKVGTGFSMEQLKEMRAKLRQMPRKLLN